jgi:pentatricopeptide repeat protein
MLYALNSAILLHTSAQQYDAAWQIYRRMCTVGPKPNTVTINTLLAACANAGRLSQAMKLFDELRSRGKRRNYASARLRLLACLRRRSAVQYIPWTSRHFMQVCGLPSSPTALCCTPLRAATAWTLPNEHLPPCRSGSKFHAFEPMCP